jgi:transaldolase/glucose-6-phosphate isomerase
MAENPLLKLHTLGQSIWLDYIRRHLLTSGELQRLIEEDGVRGVTSNPSIFQKAIAGSDDYDDAIRKLAQQGKGTDEVYQALTIEDIQSAADLFRPLYDREEGTDGFVSLEVSPHLAHDTGGTIAEARRLWQALDRPNVFIKVPATREGIPAIQQLISDGINVNVTLLFGLPRYREVADAYIAGLEARAVQGQPIDRVASVASFFLSRIDALVDPLLERLIRDEDEKSIIATRLHGQVAIASARVAYQIYKEIFGSERFQKLAGQGARVQRLLWASTSTKNSSYSDVKYVEALIGPKTVNTVPPVTLNAYRDHGDPAARLENDVDEAHAVLNLLPEVGIDLDDVTQQLEDEGVEKFIKPYDRLMDTLKNEIATADQETVDRQDLQVGDYQDQFQQRLQALEKEDFVSRLWRKDPTLWKSDSKERKVIRNALGWLDVAQKMEANLSSLYAFVDEIRDAGFERVVHLGMGGSSLAPLVFQRTFVPAEDALPVTVLDTNDPATIRELERKISVSKTLFIVASKSGSTAETRALADYFYARVKEVKGDAAGENFVAITDDDTPLVKLAKERGFRRTFLNYADIGGRYSGLSYFGLVPAALMGLNLTEMLARAVQMAYACDSCVPIDQNPGVTLGAAMGELAKQGRDKVTFLVARPISTLGMWLEQLLAESTGKEGTGLLPVADEPMGDPGVYGTDRFFVHIRLHDEPDETNERHITELQQAGHPVVTIRMENRLDLGQEFLRWEVATAVAGAILGINAFNQPNVQESKDNTKRLLEQVREQGRLPDRKPALTQDPLSLYTTEPGATVPDTIAQFLQQVQPGDYIALMAYLTETPGTNRALQSLRVYLRDTFHVATTVGYGPRFLHSTGQLHKGGPNTGLFLQLTAHDPVNIQIPDRPYSFGVFKHAEALGDLEALRQHQRRVMQIDLGPDVSQGLSVLQSIITSALEKSVH